MAAKPTGGEVGSHRQPAKPLDATPVLLTETQRTEFQGSLWIAILINLKEWS
jgi:hypothetical protein